MEGTQHDHQELEEKRGTFFELPLNDVFSIWFPGELFATPHSTVFCVELDRVIEHVT